MHASLGVAVIRRSARPARFTILDNDVIQDDVLSFRALGLLVYILSKPDHWTISAEQLADSHEEGRDAVRAALRALEDARYIRRERTQDERGRWHTHTVVYDRPVGRTIKAVSTNDGFPVVGEPAVGKSGFLVSTEEQGLSSKKNMRGRGAAAAAERPKPRSRRQVLPDETPDDDDAPALGASPRKSREQRNEVAASRGTSGYGLALRLQRGLERQEAVTATVDVGALAKRLNDLHKRGQTREVQAKMVELFVANPKRYTRGAADKGWLAFLQAVPMLQDDAGKHTRAEAGGTGQTVTLDVDDPYEGAR